MSDASGAQEAAAAPAEVESVARRMGWRPEEEYAGPKENFIPADQFVARVQENIPVLKRTLRDMSARAEKQDRELGEMKQVLTDFRDFASRSEARAYDRARGDLLAQREVAVTHADTETFKRVEADIAKLEETAKPRPVDPATARTSPAPGTPDPAITSWIEANPWFTTDQELHEAAKGFDAGLLKSKPGLSVAERLAAVKEKIARSYPEKFENPRRDAAAAVSTPSGGNGRRAANAKTYENLPSEAKKACDKFVKTIPGFKREDYVKDYDWSGE